MSFIRKYITNLIDYWFPPVYILSYPKAGRTWLRSILSEVFFIGEKHDFETEITSKTRYSYNLPTIIFSHVGYRGDKNSILKLKSYKKIILLVRDPRDIVVSSYLEHTLRSGGFDATKNMSEFLHDDTYGIQAIVDYYNFLVKNFPNTKIIRYEDLQSDTHLIIKELCVSLGLGTSQYLDKIPQAITNCEFSKMQEKAKKSTNFRLAPTDHNNPESQKIRKGRVGGYIDYLSLDDQVYAKKIISSLESEFQY